MEEERKGRLRFSLWRLFVILTFVVLAASHLLTSSQLYTANQELAKLRRETGYLDVTDPTKVHVVSIPVMDQLTWRWRVFVPEGANYWFAAQVNDVPSTEFPENGQIATLLPGEWVIELRIHEESPGTWTVTYNARSESNAVGGYKKLTGADADWLAGGWARMAQGSGSQHTDSFNVDEHVLFLRLRAGKLGVGTADAHTRRGVMLWLSPE